MTAARTGTVDAWTWIRDAIYAARKVSRLNPDPRVEAAIAAAERCERERTPEVASAATAAAWAAAVAEEDAREEERAAGAAASEAAEEAAAEAATAAAVAWEMAAAAARTAAAVAWAAAVAHRTAGMYEAILVAAAAASWARTGLRGF
jgi:hypothetical protein